MLDIYLCVYTPGSFREWYFGIKFMPALKWTEQKRKAFSIFMNIASWVQFQHQCSRPFGSDLEAPTGFGWVISPSSDYGDLSSSSIISLTWRRSLQSSSRALMNDGNALMLISLINFYHNIKIFDYVILEFANIFMICLLYCNISHPTWMSFSASNGYLIWGRFYRTHSYGIKWDLTLSTPQLISICGMLSLKIPLSPPNFRKRDVI